MKTRKAKLVRKPMTEWQKENHADGLAAGAAMLFRWGGCGGDTQKYHRRLAAVVGRVESAGFETPALDEQFATLKAGDRGFGEWLFEVLTSTPRGEYSRGDVWGFWEEYLGDKQGKRIVDEDFARGFVAGVIGAGKGVFTSSTTAGDARMAMLNAEEGW